MPRPVIEAARENTMRIIGVDFTSAPSKKKPITWADGKLTGRTLDIYEVVPLIDEAAFKRKLAEAGPWVAGFDFPFGLPSNFVHELDWPARWQNYVEVIRDKFREKGEWKEFLGGRMGCYLEKERGWIRIQIKNPPSGGFLIVEF